MDERLRELDALLHAGGVAADEAIALLVEPDVAERFGGAFACGGGGESRHAAHVGHEVGGGHIYRKAVVLGEVADELADLEWMREGVDAEDLDRAGGRGEEAEEDADEGRLAGPVCADQTDDAGLEVESERVEGGDTGVALGDFAGAEEGHGPEVWGGALETTELGRGWFRRARWFAEVDKQHRRRLASSRDGATTWSVCRWLDSVQPVAGLAVAPHTRRLAPYSTYGE